MSNTNHNKDNSELTEGLSDKQIDSGKRVPPPSVWKGYQKILFRIAFVFFLLISIPLSSGWYKNAASIDWLHPHYRDIYDIARFNSSVRNFFGIGGARANFGGDDEGAAGGSPANGNSRTSSGRSNISADSLNKAGRRTEAESLRENRKGPNSVINQDRRGNNIAAAAGRKNAQGFSGPRNSSNRDSVGSGSNERRPGQGFAGRRNSGGQDSTGRNGSERRNSLAGAEAGRRGEGLRGRGNRVSDSSAIEQVSRPRLNRQKEEIGNKIASTNGKRNGNTKLDSVENRGSDRDTTSKRTGFAAGGRENGNANGNAAALRTRSWWADYTDWGYALAIATVAGLLWTLIDRKRKEYNVLYYVIKVVVRYRAAIGIIGFGFTKLFPTQMPFPSLGLLNTDFGDFTGQKIYWLSVGIVPWYQVFGGVVELLAGSLLLFRKTATLGAILLIGALGDITFVNYSYDGGVHVYAFYFVLLGLFIIIDDIPRIYNLLIREKYTIPRSYYPVYTNNWLGYTRVGLKTLTFLIFFVILTYTETINFKYDPYKQPSTAGVKTLRGNYNVTEFKINNEIIPYNPLDSVRWQQATFENWTSLTFKVNKPVIVDPSNGGGSPMKDIQRTFEIAGTAGGQRAFHYYADTIDHVLYLQDKNALAARGAGGRVREGNDTDAENDPRKYPKDWISQTAWKHIGDENKMIDRRAYSTRRDREFARPERPSNRAKMILKYTTTDGSRVVLTGLNENRDSIYVVLDRVEKKYNLSQSTLSAGKY